MRKFKLKKKLNHSPKILQSGSWLRTFWFKRSCSQPLSYTVPSLKTYSFLPSTNICGTHIICQVRVQYRSKQNITSACSLRANIPHSTHMYQMIVSARKNRTWYRVRKMSHFPQVQISQLYFFFHPVMYSWFFYFSLHQFSYSYFVKFSTLLFIECFLYFNVLVKIWIWWYHAP